MRADKNSVSLYPVKSSLTIDALKLLREIFFNFMCKHHASFIQFFTIYLKNLNCIMCAVDQNLIIHDRSQFIVNAKDEKNLQNHWLRCRIIPPIVGLSINCLTLSHPKCKLFKAAQLVCLPLKGMKIKYLCQWSGL